MGTDVAYVLFGTALAVALAAITVAVYRRHRKDRLERPKYKMLEDDDER